MKIESLMIDDQNLSKEIINSISKYLNDLQKKLPDPNYSTILDVRISIKDNAIYVIYEDRKEDAEKIKDIIKKAIELKSKIDKTTDPVKKAEMLYQLGELSKECKELTGMDLSSLI